MMKMNDSINEENLVLWMRNEENKDLIENTTPFGLLDEETQKRMKAWPHGLEVWVAGRKDHEAVPGGWASVFEHNDYSHFGDNVNCVFRAMDATELEPEPSKPTLKAVQWYSLYCERSRRRT
jgi:hypothetical protein